MSTETKRLVVRFSPLELAVLLGLLSPVALLPEGRDRRAIPSARK